MNPDLIWNRWVSLSLYPSYALKFANTLKQAGVPSAQAEAEATALSEVLEVNLKESW